METLWKKLLFWKNKKKKFDYRLQNSEWDDSTWVEITLGKYSGVIFSYGLVRLEDVEIGIPKLKFNYNIISSGSFNKDDLINDEEFVIIAGDIITDLIIKNEQT
jgi:hypothetical protein